ncbi:MAG: CopG family antitoxin [Gammaproteobacteria bacterium]
MRPVQKFPDEYLERCREMSHDEIARFLEDFRRTHGGRPARSRLISIKIPEDLLAAFKAKAKLNGVPYQTQIKNLMKAWLTDKTGPRP